jgi:hypothetical protein
MPQALNIDGASESLFLIEDVAHHPTYISPRSPLRSPRLGVSIWKNKRQRKLNQKRRGYSLFKTWSGTLHGRPGARCSSYEEETASTIHDPSSSSRSFVFIRG